MEPDIIVYGKPSIGKIVPAPFAEEAELPDKLEKPDTTEAIYVSRRKPIQ